MAHKLHIAVEDSVYNNKFILINDVSEWDNYLPVVERRLQVMPPYLEKYVMLDFPMNQTLALTSRNLDLSKKTEDLPDGVYRIHYSVSPNHKVFVEMAHFRVSNLMNKVLGKMALVGVTDFSNMDACGNVELSKQENTLIHIWMMLRGAQAVGIDSHNTPKSEELYKQAMRIYDKLFDSNCINC